MTPKQQFIGNRLQKTLTRLYMIQTDKSLKRTLFIRTKHNMRVFRVITFIKLQNDTETAVHLYVIMLKKAKERKV